MKVCIITGAGDFPACRRPEPQPGDLLIAADGGLRHLRSLGLTPDLLVADFDSLSACDALGIDVVRLPVIKDDTDMGIAISQGRARGYRRFLLYGGTGGRPDHTFANLQALTALSRDGLRGYLFGDGWVACAITDTSLTLPALASGTISVFAIDNECCGVTIQGLKYELNHATLTNRYPLGVSNEFIGQPARIEIESGTLLIFCPADALNPRADG